MTSTPFFRWFDEVTLTDLPLVGGKNASLGEMIRNLSASSIKVPRGFAVTTKAYEHFLRSNNLADAIFAPLRTLNTHDLAALRESASKIRAAITGAPFSDDMITMLRSYYEELRKGRREFRVAIRSSASAEDLPNASFAGQQDTFLHVATFDAVLARIKDVYASLFTDRAIAYRAHHNFQHNDVQISVGIQEMVMSDQGTSGVMFSIDPESGFHDAIFINASYGLGEAVVSGAVNPDEFMIYKPALKKDKLVILNSKIGTKAKKLVYAPTHARQLAEVDVDSSDASRFCLSADDLKTLAHCAVTIESHYQRPMDIEWAQDGTTKDIFILQARPETVHSSKQKSVAETFHLLEQGTLLCEGRAVGKRIGQGRVRNLKSIEEALNFERGDVLVTDMTDPNWEPVMQKASAIVTNRGGRTCHAAIIARELGIAAVVGCHDATRAILDGSHVTVSCANGDTGQIFKGLLKIGKRERTFSAHTNTLPLMLIAANPSRALNYYTLPHQGIGLARLEFIIAHSIGIHPNALLQLNEMPMTIRNEIEKRIAHSSSPEHFYIDNLAMGIASLAAVAHPHPIIVRFSDFKTNEYEELLGGSLFEHKENNPMLGFRGAGRYIAPQFSEAFGLECVALKKAREEFGFTNIQAMVPFVRTLREAETVITLLNNHGLTRGERDLKIIMMCEIPSNVILADEFLTFFDGFSIGSNDLTQLTLGVDRDSHLVANQFSERDPAVLKMLEMAISACKRHNKYVGICGQGPSDDLNLARWLISKGIDSISLTPDTIADVHLALS